MVVCKIGGPAYRIGMGGGAASSRTGIDTPTATSTSTDTVALLDTQQQQQSDLDFNAVQRGDAEMENRMNRLVRACVDLGAANPIVSIHDQGAGGNGNVLKEIVDPLGALYHIRSIPVGDPTLSALEVWGAEYQESNAVSTTDT
jgi:phosphoribosylformylglycinamidine synthase